MANPNQPLSNNLPVNNNPDYVVTIENGIVGKTTPTEAEAGVNTITGEGPILVSSPSGDVVISLDESGVAAGDYGDATHVARITVDEFGIITAVEEVEIAGGGGAVSVTAVDHGTDQFNVAIAPTPGTGTFTLDIGPDLLDINSISGTKGISFGIFSRTSDLPGANGPNMGFGAADGAATDDELAGSGGNFEMLAGNGGNVNSGDGDGGNGGDTILQPGQHGTGSGTGVDGTDGIVRIFGAGIFDRSGNSLIPATRTPGVLTKAVVVADLPSAATATVGARAFVSDANTTVILGLGLTVVGGGANKVPVYSNGTNWLIG